MNKSKAVYLNNEWCEIIDCISCPHYDLEHDEDFPEKACMIVYYLHNIGKHLGLTTCPLPLWDDVRMHPGDETPTDETPNDDRRKNPGRYVLTKYINEIGYNPEEELFCVCNHDGTDWAHAGIYLPECIKVIGWWELPKDDIKGLYASQ